MLYNYMQIVQSSLQGELEFCLHRTYNLWQEFFKVNLFYGIFYKLVYVLNYILKTNILLNLQI